MAAAAQHTLSKGVLGPAVEMRFVACRRWQLWVMIDKTQSEHNESALPSES
jgi:hypothetical protein